MAIKIEGKKNKVILSATIDEEIKKWLESVSKKNKSSISDVVNQLLAQIRDKENIK